MSLFTSQVGRRVRGADTSDSYVADFTSLKCDCEAHNLWPGIFVQILVYKHKRRLLNSVLEMYYRKGKPGRVL